MDNIDPRGVRLDVDVEFEEDETDLEGVGVDGRGRGSEGCRLDKMIPWFSVPYLLDRLSTSRRGVVKGS